MNVRIHRTTIAAIDAARGPTSRDNWVEHACRLALKPTARFEDPELHQHLHTHVPTGPMLRTEWRAGRKTRVYACDCGAEVAG